MRQHQKSMTAITVLIAFLFIGMGFTDPIEVNGQPGGKKGLPQETGRDPFRLPSGVRLFKQNEATISPKGGPPKPEIKPMDMPPYLGMPLPKEKPPVPLKVKAILISDHIRLALLDRNIVTEGDVIHDEKVLEITNDRVILGKKDQRRTLLLSQSPIQLTVERREGE